MKYFKKHPYFNSVVHVLAGVGIGFIAAYPLIGTHPIRWGAAFLAVAVLGHLWAATQK